MASIDEALTARLDKSVFPLKQRWGTPEFRWHTAYPGDVPAGIEFEALRLEKLLCLAANRFPERIALRYFGANWTYQKLKKRVQRVAANLHERGISPGDRVLVVLPNSPEFVVAFFALHWIGAQVVPASPLLSVKDLVELADTAGVKAVFGLDLRIAPILELLEQREIPLLVVCSLSTHLPPYMRWPYQIKVKLSKRRKSDEQTTVLKFKNLYHRRAGVIEEPLLSDTELPAILQPTGGTTGTPKIAVLTHTNLHANVAQLHVWCGLEPGRETMLAVLPFFHVFGATVALTSAVAGGATLLLQARFDPKRVFRVMQKWKPSVAPMVPFMIASLCEEMKNRKRNIQGLQFVFSGASPLESSLKEEFQERTGATIFEGYGLSEASPVTHTNPPDSTAIAGSIGVPLPNTEAKVVDKETGLVELPVGEVGELAIRGPQVMQGYLKNEEETSMVLRDGWLHTGDMAKMNEDGYFTLVDRKKDMIISGGLNVFPTEVEQILETHPGVRECAVVGMPDRLYGDRVVAFVVAEEDEEVNPALLRMYCNKRMASYKVPQSIEFCDDLPKNFLGKLRRFELRKRAA